MNDLTLKSDKEIAEQPTRKQILAFLSGQEYNNNGEKIEVDNYAADISSATGISPQVLRFHISVLLKRGLIVQELQEGSIKRLALTEKGKKIHRDMIK